MTCSYCATELPSGAMFCGECGRAVKAGAASAMPSVGGSRDTAAIPVGETLVEPVAATSEPDVDADQAPDPEPDPEPALGPQPTAEAEPAPDVAVDVGTSDEPAHEPCAQCGAALDPNDIFCGECGFVRHGSAVQARPRDTVSLDPFPWGLPSAQDPAVAPANPAFDDDFDETRIVDRSARGERFVLQFSTGESVSVSGTGLLGRNPVAEPGEYCDFLVTITDPGKSVSKTHLEFGQDGGSFWISDRFSGNGTIVREPDSQPKRCEAGKRYRIVRGTRVDIGEQFFIVS